MYRRAQSTPHTAPGRTGFTITEMVVTTFLAALLALLLAAAVATFARPAAEVDGRTRLALEASSVTESLARDLGGFLADVDYKPNSGPMPGKLNDYKLIWPPSWNNNNLILNFQGQDPPPPTSVIITYTYNPLDCQLVRSNSFTGTNSVVIARHVSNFHVGNNPDNRIQVTLELTYPDPQSKRKYPRFKATYTLVGVPPP